MRRRWSAKQAALYGAMLLACLLLALASDFTIFGSRIDNYAYDVIYRMFPPRDWDPSSAVLAVDDPTFQMYKGVGRMRTILAEGLDAIATADPAGVAVDVILADEGDAAENARLAASLGRAKNLSLPVQVIEGKWEYPIPQFRELAKGLGHVHPEESTEDGVCRRVPLALVAKGDHLPRDRYFALALEALRLRNGVAPGAAPAESLRIRYRPGGIPTVSLRELKERPELIKEFRGRQVFVGITSLSARRDQVASPLGGQVAGVVIHAHAYETLSGDRQLRDARPSTVLAVVLAIAVAAGLIFFLLSGRRSGR